MKTFPLLSVGTLPDGGKDYQYSLDGHPVSIRIPPAGFNPLIAPTDELALYGIPAKPPAKYPAAIAQWEQWVSRIHFVDPPPHLIESTVRSEPAIHHSASSPLSALPALPSSGAGAKSSQVQATVNSLNWSGDLLTGTSFNQAGSSWTQPGVNPTTCSGNAAVFWTGMGGWNSGNLAQDGTALQLQNLGTGIGQLEAWWEIVPTYNIIPVNLYATVGSDFAAITKWNGSGYEFFMENYGTGQTFDTVVGSSVYDPSTAEFVAERPEVNGALTPLSDYGTVNWTTGWGQTPSQPSKDWTQNEIDMYSNDGSHKLAIGGTSAETSSQGQFSDTWAACS